MTENPSTREEAHFDADEEDTLFDARMMLASVGMSDDALDEVDRVIEETTIYDRETFERHDERTSQ